MKLLIKYMLIFLSTGVLAQKKPPSFEKTMAEPIVYSEGLQPDAKYFDGGLPHAVGVHNYQAFRANRVHPTEIGSDTGWTYNHQPYLCYWNGKFYLEYLSGQFQEHTPPTRVLLMTSENGKDWSAPEIIFPIYDLPEIKTAKGYLPAGTKAVMHQRMGFSVAPNGKLLASGFYSYCLTPRHSPNAGQGIGRVVREIKKDGSYGPIYFIRYNRWNGYNETNTNFPFYKSSKDPEFLKACEALLADKLITLQWWEEDRGKDGFFTADPGDVKGAAYFNETITTSKGAGKALSFFHRPDNIVVGIWKNQWSALSKDDGRSWTPFTRNKTLSPTGAKVWGQKLDDGRYALVHDQTAGFRNRYPMVVMVSDDGHDFDRMFSVRGDIPLRRYQGIHKRIGAQYFRGIVEGNGNPPGDELWVTYSVNKEDIWVSEINVPIQGHVSTNVDQNFNEVNDIQDLTLWNLYVPQWAPISLVEDPNTQNKVLELRDEDPYDYAKAERIFPKSKKVEIDFDLKTIVSQQGHALEIEIQNQGTGRPIRLRIDKRELMFDRHQVGPESIDYKVGVWANIKLDIDVENKIYNVFYNGKLVRKEIPFANDVAVSSVERIVFRTGPYRGYTDALFATQGAPAAGGLTIEDLPASGIKEKPCVYWIDNVKIKKLK
ncbi:MAG: hypothetical protein KDC69_00560 [Flavobacteriaceae bacterium]|nr:hypothetical protein [Flavobacteriaceae bacterium]